MIPVLNFYMRSVALVAFGALLFWMLEACYKIGSELGARPSNSNPKRIAIQNESTAIAVGLALLKPVYGGTIWSERPFKATLTNSVWWVRGSLPPGAKGGVAEIFLSETNGSVLDVYHSK